MISDLPAAVNRAAARWPDRPAWTFDDGVGVRQLTFAQVQAQSDGLAKALQDKGIRAGDRVGVLLGNQPEFPLAWLALAKLGAAMAPLNTNYRAHDLGHALAAARVCGVVSTAELASRLAALTDPPTTYLIDALVSRPGFVAAPVDPGATVNLQFTSGTTGPPKACVLSHRYWLTLGASLVEEFPRLTSADVMLTAQPFSYIDPQWNVVAALLAGAHLVVLDGFHPSTFWSKVRAYEVTYFYCLGAMPTLLLRTPPDPVERDHHVRLVQASGIPPRLHAELEERWGVGWHEAFGMTETGADIRVTDRDHDALVGTGCLGLPASHREVRVVDGELQLRGPGMMDGYLGEPDPFLADGWFPTGDLARIDEAGRVYLLGRTKDMIRRSGENIAAHQVEEVIGTHPAVRLVAVVGVPDEIRGEEVKAFVVGDVGEAELVAYTSERLAAFKVPRYWEFRDDLPRTASERVAKKDLR